MKRKTTLRLTALALLALMLVSIASCSSVKIDADISVEVISSLIYEDSAGNLFSVEYDYADYTHSIGGIHTFAEDIPKTFEGYTLEITSEKVESTVTSNDDEPETEEKLSILTVDDYDYDYGDELDIYTSKQISSRLSESNIKTAIMKSVYGTKLLYYTPDFEDANCTATDIEDWADEFEKDDKLSKEFKYKYNDTDYKVKVVVKHETYKLKDTLKETHEFAGDCSVTRLPIYNEDGKQVATRIQIATASTTFAFIEN